MTRRTEALKARRSDAGTAPAALQDDLDLEQDLELDEDDLDDPLEEPESSSDEWQGTDEVAVKPKKRRVSAMSANTPDTSIEPTELEKSTVDVVSTLSNELLVDIFNCLQPEDAKMFGQVSKRFHAISLDPFVISSFFLQTYGKQQALYHLLGRPRLVTVKVLEQCFQQQAHLSRYLLQNLLDVYPLAQNIPHWIAHRYPFFGKGSLLQVSSFAHLLQKGMQLYGSDPHMGMADLRDGDKMLLAMQRLPDGPTESQLKAYEILIEEMVDQHGFAFFSDCDPLVRPAVVGTVHSQKLYALGRRMGVKMGPELYCHMVAARVEKLQDRLGRWPNVAEIVSIVQELKELDSELVMRTDYVSNMLDYLVRPEAFLRAVKQLDEDGDLRFDGKAALLSLARGHAGKKLNADNASFIRIVFAMYPEELDQPSIYAVASSLFALADATFSDDDNGQRYEAWLEYEVEMPVEVMARMLIEPVLDTPLIVDFVENYFSSMKDDLVDAVLKSILEEPDHGHCLRDLRNSDFLKKVKLREAILARAVDFKRFKVTEDYPNCRTALGASASSYIGSDPSDITWNHSWKTAEVRDLEEIAVPRDIVGQACYFPPTIKRYSTADAVFDLFVNDREVLEVLMQHAIINGNPVLCRALITRGVTVTTFHFKLMGKVPHLYIHPLFMEAVLYTACAVEPERRAILSSVPAAVNPPELKAHEYYENKLYVYNIDKNKPAVKRLEHLRAWKGVLEELVKDANRTLTARRKNRIKGAGRITKTTFQKTLEATIIRLESRIADERQMAAEEAKEQPSKKQVVKGTVKSEKRTATPSDDEEDEMRPPVSKS